MPIYEYVCKACDEEFEKIVGFSEPAPSCPSCEGTVEKKISLSAFHLKGGGWYSDAYSGKDNKSPGESSSSSESSSVKSPSSSESSSVKSSSSSESSPVKSSSSSESSSVKSSTSSSSSSGGDS